MFFHFHTHAPWQFHPDVVRKIAHRVVLPGVFQFVSEPFPSGKARRRSHRNAATEGFRGVVIVMVIVVVIVIVIANRYRARQLAKGRLSLLQRELPDRLGALDGGFEEFLLFQQGLPVLRRAAAIVIVIFIVVLVGTQEDLQLLEAPLGVLEGLQMFAGQFVSAEDQVHGVIVVATATAIVVIAATVFGLLAIPVTGPWSPTQGLELSNSIWIVPNPF
mmetsp:Transcript_33026/g.78022  ORF Transcript_33026/g.78022 Transcript_33026/m.78022 type:complete len:218 (+) Transcript_33026:602-1255(+)